MAKRKGPKVLGKVTKKEQLDLIALGQPLVVKQILVKAIDAIGAHENVQSKKRAEWWIKIGKKYKTPVGSKLHIIHTTREIVQEAT